ncbi:hypothetical protein, partial [Chryseobacterium indoltheticum]|uniref:hypothetical protein n=1 Tax=Chryseobacterium indoltheticum TaxID=254 RepID=UPI003F490CD2
VAFSWNFKDCLTQVEEAESVFAFIVKRFRVFRAPLLDFYFHSMRINGIRLKFFVFHHTSFFH